MKSGWVGFDLDGTLAFYDGWVGEEHIGPPIREMVERAKELIEKGIEIRIVTARASTGQKRIIEKIQDWAEEQGLGRPVVTCEKDYKMICLYDDRCLQVYPNTGMLVSEYVEKLQRRIEILESELESKYVYRRKRRI